ncbi:MAG: GMP synthase (glutamine-hydrolyzing) [Ignavibacteriae bacterium HGW-Ignavibacteriae-4]|jgi:GMP synthase (glutamine-hydrolysing)|nr:MAG: GMP synthase (glutamine-hydrolyzing) [Ignavibacteriae bacterium HGW-Ignavibacteriae-4]
MENVEKILILDFGSQYTQLIARKVREVGVFAEIHPFNIELEKLKEMNPKGIILSGGPSSVYSPEAPHPSFNVFELGIPVLGICYGLQLIAFTQNGQVDAAAKREYGKSIVHVTQDNPLLEGISDKAQMWMSHGDSLSKMPDGFETIANTENAPICAIANIEKKIYGVQFHPEVHHSLEGKKVLENFVRNICSCVDTWNAESFIEIAIQEIRDKVGTEKVICGLSGGVDSTVAAVLIHKAIGDQLHCIHIDSGLMRMNESSEIYDLFQKHFDISIEVINGHETFYTGLAGVSDPELKRKAIGKAFIDLFDGATQGVDSAKWLAQGTLYPDVIESVSVKGPSATIKSHHNVGGLPEKMNLKLLEPFRELFKDEVREVGRMLGIPEWFVKRHPFPGPGLGIRILGEISPEKIEILQKADAIYLDVITEAGLYDEIWQAFAVLLPVKSVGVMGDERTYEFTCAIRAVTSTDGMTAEWYPMPYDVLEKISSRIINEIKGINRVVYDITSKPPGTIEWE